MPIKQTVPTNSGDYLQFGNATTPVAAQIGGYEDSTGNGHLDLYTTASGTVTEQVRVTSAGNVGIGTSSPTAKLDINGSVNLGQSYINLASPNGANGDFVSGYNVKFSGGSVINTATGASNAMSYNTDSIRFYTNTNQSSGSSLSERMRIDSSGNVFIGTTTTSIVPGGFWFAPGSVSSMYTGHATGTASGTVYSAFYYNTTQVGSITQSGTTGVLYNITSDYRLKDNPTKITNGLETIQALNPVNFTWNPDGTSDSGFLAHEFQSVLPRSVVGEKDAVDAEGNPVYQAMDNSGAVPFLVAAIQELNAKVTALEAQLGAK